MGRRRINRRQKVSRANSEITLNEDDASSDMSVTVHDTLNRDSPAFSDPAHVAQSNIIPNSNRFTPIEENNAVVPEASTSSNPSTDRHIYSSSPNRIPSVEFPQRNPWYGDDQVSAPGAEAIQANTLLQTFL